MRARGLIVVGAAVAGLLAVGMLAFTALASGGSTVTSSVLPIVADHLDNPRGLSLDRSGALWVAEAGRGGARCARVNGRICYGRSGAILRIVGGRVRTIASGLASIRNYLGVLGADDVSVAPSGNVFTAMITDEGELPPGVNRNQLGDELGKLLRFDRRGHPAVQANLLSATFGFDFGHPYGVLALPGRELVTDSEQNELLEIRGRRVRVIFQFPQGAHGADSVPTSLAQGPDGAVYVGELSGVQAGVGNARIWRMVPGHKPTVFATGFSAVIGIAFGPDGSLYACEFSRDYAHGDPHGDVVRVAPDGTRTRYGVGQLFNPGGVAVAQDGTIYVSNWSTLTGTANAAGNRGQIVAIRPPT